MVYKSSKKWSHSKKIGTHLQGTYHPTGLSRVQLAEGDSDWMKAMQNECSLNSKCICQWSAVHMLGSYFNHIHTDYCRCRSTGHFGWNWENIHSTLFFVITYVSLAGNAHWDLVSSKTFLVYHIETPVCLCMYISVCICLLAWKSYLCGESFSLKESTIHIHMHTQ